MRLKTDNADVSYWIKATENPYAVHSCPTHLIFAISSSGHLTRLLDYPSCEWLRYMFPPEANDSLLITVWESGSAVWVRAFRIEGETVSLIFDRASRVQPEFPWGAILLNVGRVPQPNGTTVPKSTEIWTWTGKKYRLAATVPFDQRYDALQKLPPSSWK
ncbi:MAG TPA: hypothetical protein VGX94_01500 [Terriglobia bacterium]|nr:hypothetical protein [Terriglobia bacterium]